MMQTPNFHTRMGEYLLASCNARMVGQVDETAEFELAISMAQVLWALEGEGPLGPGAIEKLQIRPAMQAALLVRQDGAKLRADLIAEEDHLTIIRTGYPENPWDDPHGPP